MRKGPAPSRDTIYALSSAAGRAAVAVIRISGPASADVLKTLCGRSGEPRRATLLALSDPVTGEPIDQALTLRFEAPHSYTGEDMVELHVHGGVAVVRATLAALARLPGLRHAEPGEFTRRALASGKLDLTQAQAIAALIDAETEAQRRSAVAALDGRLGVRAGEWRERLLSIRSRIEASIDFSDESDVSADVVWEARVALQALTEELSDAARASQRSERLRRGYEVVIAGPVNAGKSTLLNWFAGRDAAIVSSWPGTTRDPIEIALDLDGWPVRMVDVAGLRDTDDPIESEGVARARRRMESADLVLWLTPIDSAPLQQPPGVCLLQVRTKADLGDHSLVSNTNSELRVSVLTGEGFDRLQATIIERAEASLSGSSAVITGEHQGLALRDALTAARRAGDLLREDVLELAAEELRNAAAAIDSFLGTMCDEEVLDRIFSSFCIGK